MSDVVLVASGAVSALGEGPAAASAGVIGEPARSAIGPDDELARAGLSRPFVARASIPDDAADRATWLLRRALTLCFEDLDRSRAGWRSERIGLVVGTSSGGMRRAETAFAQMERGERGAEPEAATYYGPVAAAARECGLPFDPSLVVLGACASSVLAIGLGCRWLARGACDLVLAGGFDDVTVFVAAGFEALRATTASPPPRPFRLGRDGMALGEGAGIVALVRPDASPRTRARAFVTGFGAASDAVHLTAPDREGRALARAVDAALDEAGRPPIDLVSAHATATPFNDPVEARVLAASLGAPAPVVAPFKAQIGHTLGAAGVLETLLCVDALERGVLPAAVGSGPLDPEAPVRLLERAEAGAPANALKLACAFGGSNAALVVSSRAGSARPMRPSFVWPAVRVEAEPSTTALAEALAEAGGVPLDARSPERLARGDGLVRLALAAVAALRVSGASLEGAGIVVGTALATLETNAVFAARIRERGARLAEPRRFPYTSPNAVAGECSIAFGLTGPGFSVGGGLHAALEALAAAALLVEGGDAERIVVVAVDESGPSTQALGATGLRSGAVATLVSAEPRGALARMGAMTLSRCGPRRSSTLPPGHLALLPLMSAGTGAGAGALCLEATTPPDVYARIDLGPV